ncbi:hypothetical protein Cgig2_000836 [Carnegiea gigantea]|uniref:Uncharacterized protein n=1 Tax=Carnegiea gigantea TaxID=171969 RepID=A0A9Q1KKX6_9CARY|nr:hypothetical protein Cgig2_000836 [Carnegiea gigantea]
MWVIRRQWQKGGEEGSTGSRCDERSHENDKKLENNMDKQKHDILKWKNVMGETIGQKLANTYKKMSLLQLWSTTLRRTYGCMTTCIQFIRVRPNNSYTTSLCTRWKHMTYEKLIRRRGGWLVGKSLMTSMTAAYYPRILVHNLVSLRPSRGSHKHRIQNLRGAQNAVKLDIQGATVVIPY